MSTWLPPAAPAPDPPAEPSRARRWLGPLFVAGLAALKFGAKLKALLLLLPKLKLLTTSASMLVSVAAYAVIWGWRFAVGFVALLFLHEMGHVIQMKREGVKISGMLFIPFLGATAARRLRALVERRALRARQTELEGIVAAQAVARRRHDEEAALDTLRRLALAADYRDDNTHEHTQRVGELAARLARHLGHEDRTVWLIRQVAPLHDLGKIAIPDTVLLKPGRLTREEF